MYLRALLKKPPPTTQATAPPTPAPAPAPAPAKARVKIDSDEFRMFIYKIKECRVGKPHDWKICPYAHPGEKARRRDPRENRYAGEFCPNGRLDQCPKGDSCEYAHGVFEFWLHPDRYRTAVCTDGALCDRRFCFFAHNRQQLRLVKTQKPPSEPESKPVPLPACSDPPTPEPVNRPPSPVAEWRMTVAVPTVAAEVSMSGIDCEGLDWDIRWVSELLD